MNIFTGSTFPSETMFIGSFFPCQQFKFKRTYNFKIGEKGRSEKSPWDFFIYNWDVYVVQIFKFYPTNWFGFEFGSLGECKFRFRLNFIEYVIRLKFILVLKFLWLEKYCDSCSINWDFPKSFIKIRWVYVMSLNVGKYEWI